MHCMTRISQQECRGILEYNDILREPGSVQAHFSGSLIIQKMEPRVVNVYRCPINDNKISCSSPFSSCISLSIKSCKIGILVFSNFTSVCGYNGSAKSLYFSYISTSIYNGCNLGKIRF